MKPPGKITIGFNAPIKPGSAGAEIVMTAMPGMADHPPMVIKAFTNELADGGKSLVLKLKSPLPVGSYTVNWAATGLGRRPHQRQHRLPGGIDPAPVASSPPGHQGTQAWAERRWSGTSAISSGDPQSRRSWSLAGQDGCISTAGLLLGFAGAGVSQYTLLVAGTSAIVAGMLTAGGAKWAEAAAERDAQLRRLPPNAGKSAPARYRTRRTRRLLRGQGAEPQPCRAASPGS